MGLENIVSSSFWGFWPLFAEKPYLGIFETSKWCKNWIKASWTKNKALESSLEHK